MASKLLKFGEDARRGLEAGALRFLTKPVDRDALVSTLEEMQAFLNRGVRKLLVVEDDEMQRESIAVLIGEGDVETTTVASGEAALEALEKERFDCMVLDLSLPGISGIELMRKLRANPELRRMPIIVYTDRTDIDHVA